MTKELRNKFTYTSWILAVIVVVRHTVNYETYSCLGGAWLYFLKWMDKMTEIAVPTFFTISGYLFYQNFEYSKIIDKWKSRIKGLVVPYVIWVTIGYLYYVVLKHIPAVGNRISMTIEPLNATNLLKNILYGNYNGPLWFMRSLMVFVFVTPAFYWIIRRWRLGIVVCVGAILLLHYRFGIIGLDILQWLLGVWIAARHKDIVENLTCPKWISGVAIVAIVLIANLKMWMPEYEVAENVLLIGEVILTWMAMDLVRIKETPKWWMTISFFIFCTHSLILESIEKVFLLLLGNTMMGSVVDFILAPIIALGIITGAAYILKYRMYTVWKIVTGNR